jgi:hypothetical protein
MSCGLVLPAFAITPIPKLYQRRIRTTQEAAGRHYTLREADVDIWEKQMKQVFGDQATWDHSKARTLYDSNATNPLTTDVHSRLSRFDTGCRWIRRVCCRRLSTRRLQSLLPVDDTRTVGAYESSLP